MSTQKYRASPYGKCLHYTALITLLVSLAFLITITFNLSDVFDLNNSSGRFIKYEEHQETEHLETLKAPKENIDESKGPIDYDFVDDSLEDDITADTNLFDDIFTGKEQAEKNGDFAKEDFDDLRADSAAAVDKSANNTQAHEKLATTVLPLVAIVHKDPAPSVAQPTPEVDPSTPKLVSPSSEATPTKPEVIPPTPDIIHIPAIKKMDSTPITAFANTNLTDSSTVPSNVTSTSSKPMTVEIFDATIFRPWYFHEGERRPPPARRVRRTKRRLARIFPAEDAFMDRITNQLMFVPPDYKDIVNSTEYKTILLYDGLESWGIKKEGNFVFEQNECPVYTCNITVDRSFADRADMIFFRDHYEPLNVTRTSEQIYALHWRRSPPYANLSTFHHVFNWTATYRMDSTVVDPFQKWVSYDARTKLIDSDINYAAKKSKKVAWFVSECESHNNRMEYARQLQKYIEVDIFGPCGSLQCPNNQTEECYKLFQRDYKFYLAFENSNCRDYITSDVFYANLIDRDIVPVVMGAHPEDYQYRAPYHSYIHVDHFDSPKSLANYLNALDKNDVLYNFYFKWRGTGEFINTRFMCRVCALLHDEYYFKFIRSAMYDVKEWWNGPGICTSTDWKEHTDHTNVADEACGVLDRLLGKD